ncbi:NADPH:quinone reductase-like Zn-dependent oxidoreductase OS=Ureibacillus acetophenoni OX=614649 GN=SAMN05877842_113107 PE=4 SV=1 [Ureibacillus acetophenoni]
MKAVQVIDFGGPEVLQIIQTDIPQISENELLIKVVATSVNFADIKARYGNYHNAGRPPFIPGLDVAGFIIEVGSNVKDFAVGQRVIAFPKNGSYAEYVVVDKNLVFVIPENVDFDTAAACPIVSFTSYKLLADVARLQPGETVLIHAAFGGVGTTAIQLAKLLGAGDIIGSVGSEHKIPIALEAGANYVISNEKEDFVNIVNKITKGHGADVILDSIAGSVFEHSLKCLAYYGRLVNFGNASGRSGQINSNDLHSSCRSILGFSFGTTRNKRPEQLKETASRILEYLSAGELIMKIDKQYSIDEVQAAHAWVESRKSTGKVILKF